MTSCQLLAPIQPATSCHLQAPSQPTTSCQPPCFMSTYKSAYDVVSTLTTCSKSARDIVVPPGSKSAYDVGSPPCFKSTCDIVSTSRWGAFMAFHQFVPTNSPCPTCTQCLAWPHPPPPPPCAGDPAAAALSMHSETPSRARGIGLTTHCGSRLC